MSWTAQLKAKYTVYLSYSHQVFFHKVLLTSVYCCTQSLLHIDWPLHYIGLVSRGSGRQHMPLIWLSSLYCLHSSTKELLQDRLKPWNSKQAVRQSKPRELTTNSSQKCVHPSSIYVHYICLSTTACITCLSWEIEKLTTTQTFRTLVWILKKKEKKKWR